MEVIEELAANSRSWSKERHNMRRIAAVDNPVIEEMAKELAVMRTRIEKIESPRREGSEAASVEDVNYVQNGGPNRPFNSNYRPNQGGNNYNNYSGNRPHPNLSYANNNYLQPPAGFNVGQGGVIEPPKKEDKNEVALQKIMTMLGEDKKASNARVDKVEGTLSKLEETMNSLATHVGMMQTQMTQVTGYIAEEKKKKAEEEAKAAARVAEINKKWVERKSATAEIKLSGPLDKASSSKSSSGGSKPYWPGRAIVTKQEDSRDSGPDGPFCLPYWPKGPYHQGITNPETLARTGLITPMLARAGQLSAQSVMETRF